MRRGSWPSRVLLVAIVVVGAALVVAGAEAAGTLPEWMKQRWVLVPGILALVSLSEWLRRLEGRRTDPTVRRVDAALLGPSAQRALAITSSSVTEKVGPGAAAADGSPLRLPLTFTLGSSPADVTDSGIPAQHLPAPGTQLTAESVTRTWWSVGARSCCWESPVRARRRSYARPRRRSLMP